jgi:hypothetical protein
MAVPGKERVVRHVAIAPAPDFHGENGITRRSTMTLRTGVYSTIVLLLGSASAFAQVAAPVRFVEYSAKFLCGDAKDQSAAAVRPGVYETSINIHNPELPGTPQPVIFAKKAVRAPREGEEPFKFGRFQIDKLPADFAEQVDCKIIRSLLDPSALAPFIEGFVVLIVFPSPLTTPHELDVVGVYTVDTPQGGISLEMVPVAPRVLSLPGAAGKKLRDQLLEQSKPE